MAKWLCFSGRYGGPAASVWVWKICENKNPVHTVYGNGVKINARTQRLCRSNRQSRHTLERATCRRSRDSRTVVRVVETIVNPIEDGTVSRIMATLHRLRREGIATRSFCSVQRGYDLPFKDLRLGTCDKDVPIVQVLMLILSLEQIQCKEKFKMGF